MGESVVTCGKAEGVFRHLVPGAVNHALKHVGGEAGGVGLEGKVDEVVHCVDEQLRLVDRGLEGKVAGVDFRLRGVRPLLHAFDILLYRPDGFQVTLDLLVVFRPDSLPHGLRGIHYSVNQGSVPLIERLFLGKDGGVGIEKLVIKGGQVARGRDGTSRAVVRQGEGTTRRSESPFISQHQAGETGLLTMFHGRNLVDGGMDDGGLGIATRQEGVRRGMPVGGDDLGVLQPLKDR